MTQTKVVVYFNIVFTLGNIRFNKVLQRFEKFLMIGILLSLMIIFYCEKVYVEDALGDRAWVDNEHNKDFVANITKVFATVLPQKNASATNKAQGTGDASSTMLVDNTTTTPSIKGEEEKIMEEVGISLEAEEPAFIRNR